MENKAESKLLELQELLKQYEDIFKENEELPPPRDHDHQIVLKKGA